MAAATQADTSPEERTRPGREQRLRHWAATTPRPFRIFVEAQLGWELWAPGARQRMAGALAATSRRLTLDTEAQQRLARRLARVVAVLGMLGMAGTNLRSGTTTMAIEGRTVSGQAAPALATLAPTGPAKGLAADVLPVGLPVPTTAPAPAPAPTVPEVRGALPVGKGMWIWLADQAEGGDPTAIVAKAKEIGLTHLYVRTASRPQGFYAGPFLNGLLPQAHAAGIRVYAWDFPWLNDVRGDVARAVQAITYTTPDGHRVDGYAADIELRSMGVNISPQTATAFGIELRRAVGANYPLIACVPRPNPALTQYPLAAVVKSFDAIAPMVYWLGGDPVAQMVEVTKELAVYGKPILPVGQAYDAGPEGGPPGVPPREQLIRFMQAGDQLGATAVSWWSWQHADQQAWDAIRDAAEFRLPAGDPAAFTHGQVMAYQTLLTSLGFPTSIDGTWDDHTVAAVRAYQEAAKLPSTGVIDDLTRALLLTPFAPPVQPQK
ncbi:MAG TPA: peptidoglycan-binding domain-containing protein [Acidimicrobiales bacterium]|nr:peptidoglycan-binding domain-containing protein [Acidimicrobiales bacterium]